MLSYVEARDLVRGRVRSPGDGDQLAREAAQRGDYRLAAAAQMIGSRLCYGRSRAERMDAKAEAYWNRHAGGRRVARVTVPTRPTVEREWIVRAYDQHGRRFPEADYFTDNREDAEATAARMVEGEPIGANEIVDNWNAHPMTRAGE